MNEPTLGITNALENPLSNSFSLNQPFVWNRNDSSVASHSFSRSLSLKNLRACTQQSAKYHLYLITFQVIRFDGLSIMYRPVFSHESSTQCMYINSKSNPITCQMPHNLRNISRNISNDFICGKSIDRSKKKKINKKNVRIIQHNQMENMIQVMQYQNLLYSECNQMVGTRMKNSRQYISNLV